VVGLNKKEEKIDEIFEIYSEIPKKLRKIMHSHFDFLGHNITMQQAKLIQIIIENENMTHTDISKMMRIKNSTVSGIADSLVKKSLVTRKRSETDRRKVYLIVSDELKNEFKKFLREAHEKFLRILSSATDDDLENILKGFNTLNKVLDNNEEIEEEN